jgi:hypothetical protein
LSSRFSESFLEAISDYSRSIFSFTSFILLYSSIFNWSTILLFSSLYYCKSIINYSLEVVALVYASSKLCNDALVVSRKSLVSFSLTERYFLIDSSFPCLNFKVKYGKTLKLRISTI